MGSHLVLNACDKSAFTVLSECETQSCLWQPLIWPQNYLLLSLTSVVIRCGVQWLLLSFYAKYFFYCIYLSCNWICHASQIPSNLRHPALCMLAIAMKPHNAFDWRTWICLVFHVFTWSDVSQGVHEPVPNMSEQCKEQVMRDVWRRFTRITRCGPVALSNWRKMFR